MAVLLRPDPGATGVTCCGRVSFGIDLMPPKWTRPCDKSQPGRLQTGPYGAKLLYAILGQLQLGPDGAKVNMAVLLWPDPDTCKVAHHTVAALALA